ncbi:signal peptidase I [Bacillus canaveralius]|uniref:Signal peptidase I n=1 Tax=Bacillus canaveralius TaxID=1403243 RepID=A0A2N5GPA8_9BACI|nr:signal peptidase I [Bacillus canaveralius]PLR84408.1 signal peptidase I [Bacillus canaveralius]PLS00590.1 signal peptidase I [Bacillus canaveralius]RSK57875.1 signal peptidase I [Bacillus canaveralius]
MRFFTKRSGEILEKQDTKKEIMSWIKSLLFAFLIAFICRHFLFSPVTVFGESMRPTFEDRNKVIVSKISHIDHFDNIVFNAPDANEKYIKRVIGLPGDTIEVKDDVLYINETAVSEPYLEKAKQTMLPNQKLTEDFTLQEYTGKTKVPKGYLFVMGDNRSVSKDSRRFGFISYESVIGEVKFRYFPLK